MEGTLVELVSQRGLGAVAQFEDLQFSHLVGQGLARPGDVAGHLDVDIDRRQGGVLDETDLGLVDRPVLGVEARVGHQPAGPPHLVGQPAKQFIGVAIEPHLLAEPFRVKAPALAIGVEIDRLAKVRDAGLFLGQRGLDVMAWRALVQHQGWQLIEAALVERRGVDHQAAGPTGLGVAAEIAAGGVALLDAGRHGAHAIGQAWQGPEMGRKLVVGPLGDLAGLFQQLLAAGGVEARVLAQKGDEGRQVAREARLPHHRLHPAANARHLRQAQGVDLVGRHGRGGMAAHQEGIVALAIGQVGRGQALGGMRQVFLFQEGHEARAGRRHLVGQHLGAVGQQGGAAIGGDGRGQVAQRGQQRLVDQRRGGRSAGAVQHGPRGRDGLDKARADPAPGVGDIGGVPVGRGGQQADPLARLGLALQVHAVGAVQQGHVEAAVGVERHPRLVERQARQPLVETPFKDGVGQALVGGQAGQVDAVQGLAGGRQLSLTRGVGGRSYWRKLEARSLVGPALPVVLARPGGLIGLDCLIQPVGGAGRRGGRRAIQGEGQGQTYKDALEHWKFPAKASRLEQESRRRPNG